MSGLTRRFEGEEEIAEMRLLSVETERLDARLEQYLSEAEAGLKSLTLVERQAELLELRSHLSALMEAEKEIGATPEEAAERALQQFGSASEVTGEIVRVRRERRPSGWQLAGALSVVLMTTGASRQLVALLAVQRQMPGGGPVAAVETFLLLATALVPLSLGLILARLFPRARCPWLPIVAAALLWHFWTSLQNLPSAHFLDALDRGRRSDWLLQASWGSGLFWHTASFLVLALAARNVSVPRERFTTVRDVLRRFLSCLPDSWAGGLVVKTLVYATLSLWSLPSLLPNFQSPSVLGLLIPILIGVAVGLLTPRCGWQGLLLSATWLLLRCAREAMRPHPSHLPPITLILALVPVLIAYFVGRKRIASR